MALKEDQLEQLEKMFDGALDRRVRVYMKGGAAFEGTLIEYNDLAEIVVVKDGTTEHRISMSVIAGASVKMEDDGDAS